MTLRLFVPLPLAVGVELSLPPGPARHAQVRRMQPGEALLLFNGEGGQWHAQVLTMGRTEVSVRVLRHEEVSSELTFDVTLAIGMPANERMDWLVEKATELGVARIQPLICERSVLRLAGEREQRKRDHWLGVAIAAAEQSGRVRVPEIAPALPLSDWLHKCQAAPVVATRWVLSFQERAVVPTWAGLGDVTMLSGPEGGLTTLEEDAAKASGFVAITLGPRVLRAETAPLAVLAWLGMPH